MVLRATHSQVSSPGPSNQRSKLNVSIGASTSKLATSPFLVSTNAGSSGSPQKIFENAGDLKPPKPPEKPLMPYMRYRRKMWDQVKAENPEKKMWEIGSIIGQLWRELSEDVKNEYCEEYEVDKLEYERKMKIYENSPDYLAHVSKKPKAKIKERSLTEEKVTGERPAVTEKVPAVDRRIEIQPAEDDDDMAEGLTARHIAFARYIRNYRLMNEIFSDNMVPDVRSVVTTNRIDILKRQVESLTTHQKKLERELQLMEDRYELKRRKFNESKETFNAELKKLGIPTEKP